MDRQISGFAPLKILSKKRPRGDTSRGGSARSRSTRPLPQMPGLQRPGAGSSLQDPRSSEWSLNSSPWAPRLRQREGGHPCKRALELSRFPYLEGFELDFQ